MKILLTLLFILIPLGGNSFQDPFRWDFDTNPKTVRPGESLPLEVTFLIPPKHFLYKDKMSLTLLQGEGFKVGPPEFPPSMRKKDPFSGKDLDIFEGGTILKTKLSADKKIGEGKKEVRLLLTYQGCSDSLCYRLTKQEIALPVTVILASTTDDTDKDRPFLSNPFQHKSLLLILLLTFLAGLVSDFTPCVLPIIPITLAFIGIRKEESKVGKNFLLSLGLVLSMSLTYALFGVAAALLGKGLGFLFQNLWFLLFSSLLYTIFALSLFGLFEIQFPLQFRNRLAKMGGSGAWGSILSGITVGLLAAPCVGPVIASLLVYVAHDQHLLKGFSLLFAYGLGMGSLFLVIGSFYHRLAARIRGGAYMVWVKKAFALLLLIPAVYYGGLAFAHFQEQSKIEAVDFWLGPEEGLAKAAEEKKPVFMDFYATWCFPCVEMEKTTFRDPDLRKFLTEKFVPIQVDCSQETPSCQKMVEKYSVIGWPTFLILDPQGKVVKRIIGENLSARELRDRLDDLLVP